MTKKKTYFLIMIILVVLLGMTLVLPVFMRAGSGAYADTDSFLKSEFSDSNLYLKLRDVSGNSTINVNTFKDATTLDLSHIVTGAPEQNKLISNLSDLRKFDLTNLKKLILSNNNIETIEADVFEGMTNLEYLDVSNNNLSSIDISMLSKLKVLILNNNNLTSLDVSNMVTTGYGDQNSLLNVSHNDFADFASIQLPNARSDSKFDIIGYSNNFTDIISLTGKFNYVLGLQGVNNSTIDQSEDIKYYNTGDITLGVRIYKITHDQNGDDIETLVSSLSDSEASIVSVSLEVGNYRAYYYKDGLRIDSTNNNDYIWFESVEFGILPDSPKYVFEINGKRYEEIEKLTREAKLILIADENATVYYSLDSSDWKEGREVVLDRGGNYIVQFKCVVDGVESKVSGVSIKASINLKVPDLFLLLIILLVGGLFVVAIYFIGKFIKRR